MPSIMLNPKDKHPLFGAFSRFMPLNLKEKLTKLMQKKLDELI